MTTRNGEVGMQRGPVVLWTALAALALVDFAFCRALGLSFTQWFAFLAASGGIAGVGLIYGLTGRSARIASMANWMLLWMVFSMLGAILTYVAAARGAAWQDGPIAAIDEALGLDWVAWIKLLTHYPWVERGLALAYESLMPQILLSVIYFAYRGVEDANYRLLLNAFVSLLLTAAVFSMLPAVGPAMHYLQSPAAYDLYLTDLQGLHDGTRLSFAIPTMKGIVCLPSFHTVLALLLIDAHRRLPTLIPVALLNLLMLVSIPSEGAHYFVDVLAGAAVAGLAILATTALAQCRRTRWSHHAGRASPSVFRPEGESG